MTTSDARKRNAETAQDPHAFTREWLRWVDESQHFTPAHPLNLTPTTQEPDMTAKTRHDELVALLNKISEESVTASNVLADMLDLLRDRLPEPEDVNSNPDLPARNLDWLTIDLARAAREHISRNQPVDTSPLLEREREEQRERAEKAEAERDEARSERDFQTERADGLGLKLLRAEAKHAALRDDVERGAHYWTSYKSSGKHTQNVARAAGYDLTAYLDRDDACTPQADPDTVTLRRDDTEALLSQWEDRGYHETDEGVDPLYSRVRAALGWGDEA